MKVAITGATGLLGSALVDAFRTRHTVYALSHSDLEITDGRQARQILAGIRPDVVIHTAAIRDPDTCELNPAQAFLVNFHGARNVAEAAREARARVVHISTDAVFDGAKQTPYTESDQTIPRSVYGRTKLRAERFVLAAEGNWAFRISILFGPESDSKRGSGQGNFISKGLEKIAAGEPYVVAADQVGTATYTLDAAQKILEVVGSGRSGLYHLANSGACSRLELAKRAAVLARLDPNRVSGEPLSEMGRPGPRPKYAVMAMDALERGGFARPRSWQEALAHYVPSCLPRAAS